MPNSNHNLNPTNVSNATSNCNHSHNSISDANIFRNNVLKIKGKNHVTQIENVK